jgi:GTP cyclohydrolase II
MSIIHLTQADLPTRFGDFTLHIFRDEHGTDSMALVFGEPRDGCLVRVHSECATGDILGSLRCDCRDQLEASLRKIAAEGSGLFLYMRGHEGRGIGLANKIKAYALQENGLDTVEANVHLGFPPDARDYASAADIIKHFGLSRIRLLTNNQDKMEALEAAGIVEERVPLWTASNPHNADYLLTKQSAMGHLPGCQDKA